MRGRLSWILTQRPLLKIIHSIKSKIIERLEQEIGAQFAKDIKDAMADGGEIDEDVMGMIEDQQVDLVDADNTPLL